METWKEVMDGKEKNGLETWSSSWILKWYLVLMNFLWNSIEKYFNYFMISIDDSE